MPHDGWAALLAAAAGLHLGFQLTVTALVYPALAEVPADGWRRAHDRHSRRITPLVAVVYGLVLAACGGVLVTGPPAWSVAAVAASGVALLLTAAIAAPLHGRLGGGHDPALVHRLLVADRARAVAALASFGCALAGLA